MIYGQNPKYHNNGCLGAKFRIGMCQQTMIMSISRVQAYGTRNGVAVALWSVKK